MNKVCILFVIGLVALQCTANAQENRLAGQFSAPTLAVISAKDFSQSRSVPVNYRKVSYPVHSGRKRLRFILDIEPFGLLISPKIKGFRTWTEDTYGDSDDDEDEVDSSHVHMPGVKFGFGHDTDMACTDLTLGWGSVINKWSGFYGELSLAPRFNLGKYVKVGPQLGLLYFDDAEWDEYSTIDMDGGFGTRLGINVLIGNGRQFISLSVSRVNFAYDVSADSDSLGGGWFFEGTDYRSDYWYANRDELDISGTRYSIGFYGRF